MNLTELLYSYTITNSVKVEAKDGSDFSAACQSIDKHGMPATAATEATAV